MDLIVIFTVISAAFLSVIAAVFFYWAARFKKMEKSNVPDAPPGVCRDKKPRFEWSKVIILLCLLNGFAWVWFSYFLAYTGREQIAESLSQTAVVEIIGSVLTYCIKSAVENLSKHNAWPDKRGASRNEEGEV